MPIRLDSSNGCNANCTYCFSSDRGGKRNSQAKFANPESLEKTFNKVGNGSKNYDVRVECFMEKVALHFGGMSDPLDINSLDVSYKLLKQLSKVNYPIVLSTKFPERLLEPRFMSILYKYSNFILQVSFSSFTSEIANKLEPNCSSPSVRISAMEKLSKLVIKIHARIQPIFLQLEDEILEKLIPALASCRCSHVSLEMYKLPVEKENVKVGVISNLLNIDLREEYRLLNAKFVGREWILPNDKKIELLSKIKYKLNSFGITVGLAEYGLYHYSDTNCCCGSDKYENINWCKGNFTHVLKNAPIGKIYLEDLLCYWTPEKSISMYINSNSRIKGISSIKEYLIDKWNSPGTINAPDSFLDINRVEELDGNGNVVYEKKERSL